MPASRERILEAAVIEISRRGYSATSVMAIADRAHAAPSELYRHFADKEDLCRQAIRDICDRFDLHMMPVYARPQPWSQRIRAAAFAAAAYCCDHEEEIRFAISERDRRGEFPEGEQSLRLHLAEVDSARSEIPDPEAVPAAAAEFVVGSFLQRVLRAYGGGSTTEIVEAIPALLFTAHGVYLGLGGGKTTSEAEMPPSSDLSPPPEAER